MPPTVIRASLLRGGRALTVAGVLASAVGAGLVLSPPAWAVGPVNPVVIDAGDPANSGFLVFVEGDVRFDADESEGTVAAGGNATFARNYNVIRPGSSQTPQGVALYVGGALNFPAAGSGAIHGPPPERHW